MRANSPLKYFLAGGLALGLLSACEPQRIDEGPDFASDPSAFQDLMLRSDAAPSAIAANAQTCADIGGTWRQDGMLQAYHCFQTYSDGGESCTDGDQCEGDCRVTPADETAGQCTPDSSAFGCYSRLEDGEPTGFLCVD